MIWWMRSSRINKIVKFLREITINGSFLFEDGEGDEEQPETAANNVGAGLSLTVRGGGGGRSSSSASECKTMPERSDGRRRATSRINRRIAARTYLFLPFSPSLSIKAIHD